MTQPASVGTLSKFGMGSSSPSNAYEYKTFTLGKKNTVLSTDGIRGTRSHPVERTRPGTYTITGQITMEPGSTTMTNWLPFIMGTSGALTETLAAMVIGIDRIARGHTYAGCKVDKCTWKATQGGILSMALDIEGLTESVGGNILSAAVPQLDLPWTLMDATLSIGGTPYQFREIEIVVDNHLKKDRFMNSVSRTDLPALDRTVSVSLTLPYTTDTISLYDTNEVSAVVVATFNNGSATRTFTMPAVQFPTETIDTPGRDEILLPYKGIARKTGTTLELTIS